MSRKCCGSVIDRLRLYAIDVNNRLKRRPRDINDRLRIRPRDINERLKDVLEISMRG
jgi:hypothetical protein